MLANRVAVVGRVRRDAADRSSLEGLQQRDRLRSVAALTGGQQQANESSAAIDGDMQLRRQSASAATETAPRVGFLFFSPD
jgi:hypothetical protein